MEDFVRLIQRYRGLYVTAIFASVGWLLTRVVEVSTQPGVGDALQVLDRIRGRADVAAVLCVVPVLNSFFVALIFEAQFHMQSLAQYRFLLGRELGRDVGNGGPAWRWELWKQSPQGSIRAWTNPSNVFFGVTAIVFPLGALWFGWPAVRDGHSPILWTFWICSSAIFAAVAVTVIIVGLMNRKRNRRELPWGIEWSELKGSPMPKSASE